MAQPYLFLYVGPPDVADHWATGPSGAVIRSPEDVVEFFDSISEPLGSEQVVATFVVDKEGDLRVAPRRSEHIACAGGNRSVRAAGEIGFVSDRSSDTPSVTYLSNYSTGFCPDAVLSWPALQKALTTARLLAPSFFTRVITFRRCPECQERNVVKDVFYSCAMCGADLPQQYNFLARRPE